MTKTQIDFNKEWKKTGWQQRKSCFALRPPFWALLLLLCFIPRSLVAWPAQAETVNPILIAHAGGGIDGHTYTNSLEALELAIKNGFKYIELDLIETLDGHIVAAHDWNMFHKMTGGSGGEPLTLHEFKQRKIHGKYTPLTYAEINDYFTRYNHLVLVTDKISNYELLLKEITVPQENLQVIMYEDEKYWEALSKGIKKPRLCLSTKEMRDSFLAGRMDVAMVTFPLSKDFPEARKELANQLNNGVSIFVPTSNDVDFIRNHIGTTVTGFFTDFVTLDQIFSQR